MECKICLKRSEKIFDTLILKKYIVSYFKCTKCRFIQTEDPYWISEAYSSVITSLDIGLISRNIKNAPIVETLIKMIFQRNAKFLDYGGGYGMFVRLMRDKGFDFYRQDVYCENIFSKNFDLSDMVEPTSFEMVTAFEVFEHLLNPMVEIKKMLDYSESIFFTTCIYPQNQNLLGWWYLIPETGQHIALYSLESLSFIAKELNLNLYTYYNTYHLFTKKKISLLSFKAVFNSHFQFLVNRAKSQPSLLQNDFNAISKVKM